MTDDLFANPDYSERMVYYFRHFLYEGDPYTYPGWNHRAAEAARHLGLFWEMADEIFEDIPITDEPTILAKAEDAGCDMDEFFGYYDAGVVWDRIVDDTNEGMEAVVFGTPFVFVNGVMVYPWTGLQDVLDCLLGYSVYVPPDAGLDGGDDAG